MKVLIGVDGSEASFAAAEFTGRILGEQDELVLFFSPPPVYIDSESPLEPSMAQRARQAVSNVVFEEAAARLPATLRSRVINLVGPSDPRQGMIDAAGEGKIDLIVVGATGAGFVEGLLLGSVGRAMVYSAPCPVLVVRPQPNRPLDAPVRVLLADDRSAGSRRAGALLRQFTWPDDALGWTIRVVSSRNAGKVPDWLLKKARSADAEAMARAWDQEHATEVHDAESDLAAVEEQLPRLFHGTPPLVVEGQPATRIIEEIEQRDIDLLAIGSHGKNLVQRWLMGSTSEHLFTYAPCSVLIAREA